MLSDILTGDLFSSWLGSTLPPLPSQTLMKSLQAMLDYPGEDLAEVFGQTFRIGYRDVFGNSLTHDLVEGGDSVEVTQDNKLVG